jgi:GNAT superfamily N-acetyltransferase
MHTQTTISALSTDELQQHFDELGALLQRCVAAGASIGFVLPFSHDAAIAFWRDKVLAGVRGGGVTLLVARRDRRIVGTVQLDADTPDNQRHRAEVRKMMVDPACRRQGVARALLSAIEAVALTHQRCLLTLDTRTGDAAEPFYASAGYLLAGVIPGYCRDPANPAQLDGTSLMYKRMDRF